MYSDPATQVSPTYDELKLPERIFDPLKLQ